MTARAIVVGVESYPNAEGFATSELAGTNDAAMAYYEWLVNARGLDAADVWLHIDDDRASGLPNVGGTMTAALVTSLQKLIDVGAGSTSELFVFFSGHGLMQNDQYLDPAEQQTDALVMADFVSIRKTGNACVKVDELQTKLRSGLGPGDHLYFLDACRNEAKAPISSNLGFSPEPILGAPTVYSMYSTAPGEVAAVGSGFAAHTVAGLDGSGTAKQWVGSTIGVWFESLYGFVRDQVTDNQVWRSVDAGADRLIHELSPPPTHTCTIGVRTADAQVECVYTLRSRRNVYSDTFVGGAVSVDCIADTYVLDVTQDGTMLTVAQNGFVELFDDQTVICRADEGGRNPSPSADPTVTFNMDSQLEVQITSEDPAFVPMTIAPGSSVSLPEGRYRSVAMDPRGDAVVASEVFVLERDTSYDLGALAGWDANPIRDSLARALPAHAAGPNWVDFSETLQGPIVDPDLAVWLAILGASRIVDDPIGFSKIGDFDLFDATAATTEAPVYVLTALGELSGTAQLDVGTHAPFQTSGTTSALCWAELDGPLGPNLVTVRIDGHPVRTFVTHGFPGRATLLTLTDRDGSINVGQYNLPIAGRESELVSDAHAIAVDIAGPLQWVRYSAQAQRAFSSRARLAPGGADFQLWTELVHGKWVDPIMSLLAVYESIRRGVVADFDLDVVLDNLDNHFWGMADVEYARAIAYGTTVLVDHPPLVMEGAVGLGLQEYRGMPATHFDYSGPWTGWVHAEPS